MDKLIFLDTETTGNDLSKDRLCQVCYKTSKGIFTEYFKPPLPMSVKSMSITHITNKMLVDKLSFIGSKMFTDLQDILKDGILVAHNAKFDIAMLESEGLKVPKKICTLRVARYLDPSNLIPEYNLQYLRYFLDLEVEGSAHDAEGDVNVLYAIFQRLLSKVKEELPKDEDAINKMLEISEKPSLFTIFTFGKYKDKPIIEVLKTDRRYLEWLLNSKLENENDDEDWIYTLRHYLGKNTLF
jgi:DNA polymerase-3 subunit alpha (Gram-positive type)